MILCCFGVLIYDGRTNERTFVLLESLSRLKRQELQDKDYNEEIQEIQDTDYDERQELKDKDIDEIIKIEDFEGEIVKESGIQNALSSFGTLSHLSGSGEIETEKPTYCLSCGKAFTFFSHLEAHHTMCGRDEAKKPVFKCDKCLKEFAHQPSLIRHQNTTHKEIELKLKCVRCQQIFDRRDNLSRHRDLRTCRECGNKIICVKEFENHRKTHKIKTRKQ